MVQSDERSNLNETVLQFGGGRFLRGFADFFIHEANESGQQVGKIVVIQSTGSGRAESINRQQGRYHVLTRGMSDGGIVDRVDEVRSISRALTAAKDWEEIIRVAMSPELRYIISNTTETGLALDPLDCIDSNPPKSFPAKLLQLLKSRWEKGGSGLTILPCELVDDNASRLLALVIEQAQIWNYADTFLSWITEQCIWRNTLVDRIVTEKPAGHPLLESDPLLTVTEPFALWAIKDQPGMPNMFSHSAILLTPDVRPFQLRKVRILNGAHTALVWKALPMGYETVREAIDNPEILSWLSQLLFEEILPAIEGRVEESSEFAEQILERFANPFLEHKLADIAVNHNAKLKIRLKPTREEYEVKFGRQPVILASILGTSS